MAQVELIMPKMGESIIEATILKWVKQVGDRVEIDETILEIATDKVDSDVPSEFKGKLIKKNFEVNDIVKVGDTIAEIETDSIENDDEVIDNSPKKQEDIFKRLIEVKKKIIKLSVYEREGKEDELLKKAGSMDRTASSLRNGADYIARNFKLFFQKKKKK